MKHAIDIETIEFERSHGRTPRGRGSWAFSLEARPQNSRHILWTPSMTYSEACAYIKRYMQAALTKKDVAETSAYMMNANFSYAYALPNHLQPGVGGAYITLFVQP